MSLAELTSEVPAATLTLAGNPLDEGSQTDVPKTQPVAVTPDDADNAVGKDEDEKIEVAPAGPEFEPVEDDAVDDDAADDLGEDDDLDEFDDIDEDDFDDGFDDDFEEELDDDYEIEIDDEISDEFGLSTGPPKESKEFELGDFDDFDGMFR